MDLIDRLKTLSLKISKQLNVLQTEEATKNALVMPFISALGYDVFDPTEVKPELIADVGTKKGEKVDYAVFKEGKLIIIFECKKYGTDLSEEHLSQLYRYFSVTEARFAVLTDGIIYRFYTDLDEPNKIDSKPFFEFNLLDIKEPEVEELKRFTKTAFNLNENLTAAIELKYTREIKQYLKNELANPSEEFVKFFATQVYSRKLTQAIKQQFTELVKKAFSQFLYDYLSERLKSALQESTPDTEPSEVKESEPKISKVVTTEEEMEGYSIIKSILGEILDAEKVMMRDTINYCGVCFDGNSRKTICRMYFNNSQKKYLGLFDDKKTEEKFPLSQLSDIHQYSDQIKATAKRYLDNA